MKDCSIKSISLISKAYASSSCINDYIVDCGILGSLG